MEQVSGGRLSRPAVTVVSIAVAGVVALSAQPPDSFADALRSTQMDLATTGKPFLIREASQSAVTLIGGLHGDKETPTLVQESW